MLVRYIDENKNVRVCITDTTSVGQDAYVRLQCSPIALSLITQAMTGAILLVSDLKIEGTMSFKFDGDGPIGHITVEANMNGEARGFAGNLNLDFDPSGELSWFQQALNDGRITVRRKLSSSEHLYTSTVPIIAGNLATNIAHYLNKSDQIRSAISLAAHLDVQKGIAASGGILIQALPGANDNLLFILEDRLVQLGDLASYFARPNGIQELVDILMEGTNAQLLSQDSVSYRCHCSRDRISRVLAALPQADLTDMADSGEDITMNCSFCTKPYVYSSREIRQLCLD